MANEITKKQLAVLAKQTADGLNEVKMEDLELPFVKIDQDSGQWIKIGDKTDMTTREFTLINWHKAYVCWWKMDNTVGGQGKIGQWEKLSDVPVEHQHNVNVDTNETYFLYCLDTETQIPFVIRAEKSKSRAAKTLLTSEKSRADRHVAPGVYTLEVEDCDWKSFHWIGPAYPIARDVTPEEWADLGERRMATHGVRARVQDDPDEAEKTPEQNAAEVAEADIPF